MVDDAIVEVQNVYRHIEKNASPMDAALIGSGEIRFTALPISASLIAAFIPLLFREFALTVGLGRGLSLRVADARADAVLTLPAPPGPSS